MKKYKKSIPYIILSYPRSGNHWTRYIVEWFSLRPTLGNDDGEHEKDRPNPSDKPLFRRVNIPNVDARATPIAKKRHWINDWDSREAKLLLIVRDYRECVVRHLQLSGKSNINIDHTHTKNQLWNYFGSIEKFDTWHSDKLYVHYEDLLIMSKNFETTLERLLNFMDIYDEDMYKDFIRDKEFHKTNSLKTLHATGGTSGDHTKFHSKKLTPQMKQGWNNFIKTNWPKLKEKYVSRYE